MKINYILENKIEMIAKGHAKENIVCAAISALLQSLYHSMKRLGIEITILSKKGYLKFQSKKINELSDEKKKIIEHSFEFIFESISEISKQNNLNIEITKRICW